MPRSSTSDTEIESLSDYLEVISDIDVDDQLLLRGQRSSSWSLIPSVGRLTIRDGWSTPQVERLLLAEFKRRSLPYLAGQDQTDLEVLAIAQHYGLATRLLDWTGNPLAALWFAVQHPAIKGQPGLVVAYVPTEADFIDEQSTFSPFSVTRTRFFQPRHLDRRIAAQDGWFSLHRWNTSQGRFSRIDHVRPYAERMVRLEIPASCFATLRAQLDRVGVNQATMYADLDGLARHLNWQQTLLKDEG